MLWRRAGGCAADRGLNDLAGADTTAMPLTLVVLLAGFAIAVIVYVASGGHVFFLPLILLLPFGIFIGRRHRP